MGAVPVTAAHPGFARTTELAARHPFVFLARRLGLTAESGQVALIERTGAAEPADSFAGSRTMVAKQPAWEHDAGLGLVGLLLGASSAARWDLPILPQACSGLVDLIERGAVATAGAGLWSLANDAATGARLWIEADGTYYQLKYSDGTTTRISTMAVAPTLNARLRLSWSLSSAGVAQLAQRVGSGAYVNGSTPAALALPAAWGSGFRLRLNSIGTANFGSGLYLGATVLLGVQATARHEALLL